MSRPSNGWLSYRFSGDIWGYPEGEVYFPGSPILRVEGSFAECVLLETVILSILNHDSAIAAAASRMSAAAGGRPDRDGRAPHPRAVGGGLGPRGVRRRLRRHLRPGGRIPLGDPDGRHERPRLHAAARHRARRVPGPGGLAGPGHDAAGRHVRRDRGGPGGRRDRGPRAGRRTDRLRGPAPGRAPGPPAARRAGGDGHEDRGDLGPGRVRHRLAGRRAGGRVRGGHPARHRERPPHLLDGLQAGGAR